MTQSKIWIDVTDLSVWTGHFTGIQRVVYQLAIRYEAQENVRYFTFNSKDSSFRHFDFSLIREQVQQSEAEANAETESTTAQSRASLNDHVKGLAVRAYHRSPQGLKDYLTPVRKHKIKEFYRDKHQLVNQYKSPKAFISSRREVVNFQKDDTVLIMGKPWDYPEFIDTLREEKLKREFKLVHLVYDMIPVFHQNLFGIELFTPYARHLFEAVSIAEGLIAISESTKRDISRFCKELLIPEPPIKVIRLGDDLTLTKSRKPDLDLAKESFILCVGTIEVRKNYQLLYATYKEGLARGIKLPKLVIVGGLGWYAGDVLYQLTHDPELWGLVYVAKDVSDSRLHWLYSNCLFTIFPSIYEGWGLPVAESLAYGKLCIASKTSSMPEIAGDLIDYFSPYNSEECLSTIAKYLDPKALREKEQGIKDNYKLTSWDDTFSQVKKFIDKIMKN